MKIELPAIIVLAVIAISQLLPCLNLQAQEIPHLHYPSLSVGAEGGWMQSRQSGSFRTDCGCGPFKDGKGNSGMTALFGEMELNRYLTVGLKFGLDFKRTSSSYNARDTMTIVYDNGNNITSGAFDMISRADISLTYLFISPSIAFTPFGQGLFIRLSPEFGNLLSSNLVRTREIPNQVIVVNGDTIKNVRFQNGTQRETLEDGPIPDVNKLRVAVLFSAGYDFRILSNFSVVPEASYDLPLTNVASGSKSDQWKISSIVLALGIKYRID